MKHKPTLLILLFTLAALAQVKGQREPEKNSIDVHPSLVFPKQAGPKRISNGYDLVTNKDSTLLVSGQQNTRTSQGPVISWLKRKWEVVRNFFSDNFKDIFINSFGTFFGALLGLITAYWLYRVQTRNAVNQEASATLQRHKEHLRYFAGAVEDVLTYATIQADALDKFVREIDAAPTTIQRLGIVAGGSVDRLNRVDSEATFHAYNVVLSSDTARVGKYRKFLSICDILTRRVASARESFKNYQESVYKQQLVFKYNLQQAANDAALLLDEFNSVLLPQVNIQNPFGTPIPSTEVAKLNQLVLANARLNGRHVAMEEYILQYATPLQSWLNFNSIYLPQRGKILRSQLKDVSTAYNDVKDGALSFKTAFATQEIRKAIADLAALNTDLVNSIGTV